MNKMVKRGLFLGLIVLLVSAVTIYFTIDLKALASLDHFKLSSLILAALALIVGLFFDGRRLQRLVKMIGYDLSLQAVLRVIFSNYFMALLTPGASGGAVAQVLILKSYGIPLMEATPIVLVRTIFSILFLIVMLPLVVWQTDVTIPYISQGMLLTLSFLAVFSLLLVLYLLQTKFVRSLIYQLGNRLHKTSPKSLLIKLDRLNEGFGLLYKHPRDSFLVFIESGLSLLALYCIGPALMFAFTGDLPLVTLLGYMIVLNLILYFAPTPGGTGVAEGLFIVLFGAFVPTGTIGLIAVAWRLVAEYIPFLIGMYAVLTLYGAQFIAKASKDTEANS
ncbi:MAG: flippase-like domain-containing protein [Veillonella sp.]|nr:flippase-like domain-containing protein [Veillonella sp.]